MTSITLRAKSDGTEISGELVKEYDTAWVVRIATETHTVGFYKDQWDRVYALPTTPGTVFRATVRGVENVRVMRYDDGVGGFWSSRPIDGEFWQEERHIDASTVRIELKGDV